VRLLAVDLASKFSAGVLMDDGGQVLHQFDSWNKSSLTFAWQITDVALMDYGVDLILIEDVPYGISNQSMVKPVLRLQGIIIGQLARASVLSHTRFLNPSTWQNAYEGVGRVPRELAKEMTKTQKDKYRIEQARLHAERLGYTGPDLLTDYAADIPEKGKERTDARNQLKKASTDYVDAFLMAKWAQGVENIDSLSGCQPVFI
jgi:hypothetical protein